MRVRACGGRYLSFGCVKLYIRLRGCVHCVTVGDQGGWCLLAGVRVFASAFVFCIGVCSSLLCPGSVMCLSGNGLGTKRFRARQFDGVWGCDVGDILASRWGACS